MALTPESYIDRDLSDLDQAELYQRHEFNKMPQMRESDYTALLDSLRLSGFSAAHPIVMYENAILDGWNRYRACQELDIAYTERNFFGSHEEAVEFVHQTNTRRNLTPNEQAELIGQYYEDLKQVRGGDHKSEAFKNQKGKTDPPILTACPKAKSNDPVNTCGLWINCRMK